MADNGEYKARYRGVAGSARVIGRSAMRAVRNAVTGNSGGSGRAARAISGRQRQVDAELERMYHGQSTDNSQ